MSESDSNATLEGEAGFDIPLPQLREDPHFEEEDVVAGAIGSGAGGADTSVVASAIGEEEEGDDEDDKEEEDNKDDAIGGVDQVIAIESSGSEFE